MPSQRSEGAATSHLAASPEKSEAHFLEYVEDFLRLATTQMVIARSPE